GPALAARAYAGPRHPEEEDHRRHRGARCRCPLRRGETAMTMQSTPVQKKSLPIVPAGTTSADLDIDVEAELRAFEEAERERLGLKAERKQWADDMLGLTMKRKERDHVTLLISGLTAAQDFLAEGALKGLGYKVEYFGMSDNRGLQAGKEFG